MKTKFYEQTGLNGRFIELDYGSYNLQQIRALIPDIRSFSIPPKASVTVYSQNSFIGPKYTFANSSNQFKKIVCFTNVFDYTIRSLMIECACRKVSGKPNVMRVDKINGFVPRGDLEFSYTILDPIFEPPDQISDPEPKPKQGIIILHDFGARKEQYFCLQEKLALKGFKVFVMDQRGHGYTSPSLNMTWGEIIEDNRNIAAGLGLYITKPILLGHGYGGAIAQYWAQLHKLELNKLILIGSAPYSYYPLYQPIEPSTQAWLSGLLTLPQYARIVSNATYNDTSDECEVDKLKQDLMDSYAAADINSLKLLRQQNSNFTDQTRFIITPTLLIHGAFDSVTIVNGSKQINALLSTVSRLRIMHDAGHSPHQTKPIRVLDHITSFASQ